jgi:hypothetical protein
VYLSALTLFCIPAYRSQPVGLALGARAGGARVTEILRSVGFSRVRRAAESPLNYVLEARP